MIPKPERSSYTTLDFAGWHSAGALQLSPKFQRRDVWTIPARSYFIDSILKNMPVPPLYLRVRQSDDMTKTIREVIDGQQRLRSLLDFLNDKFALTASVCDEAPGKRFSQLATDQQNCVRQYSFVCETFSSISDASVLEVFARLNTHSVQLNEQELRNGKFFGEFKRCSYRLAHDYLEFWTQNKIFTNARIARMLEVEFTSELLVLGIDGLQDKKKSLNNFYTQFDEKLPNRRTIEKRFRATIDEFSEVMADDIPTSEFKRPPLFYSAYACIFHRMFGLPKARQGSPKRGKLTRSERNSLRDTLLELSEVLVRAKSDDAIRNTDQAFVTACLTQTDNQRPREVRFKTIYSRAFK